MIAAQDFLQIIVTTLAVTLAVTLLEVVLLRFSRRASVASRGLIVTLGALASVVLSVLVVAGEMYLSGHDTQILLWMVCASAVLSLAAAWLVGRGLARSLGSLRLTAGAVDGSVPVHADRDAPREVRAVSEQLAETSRRLAEARAELRELEKARSMFFAWISHDLRTPITGIRALAEALEEGAADDRADYQRQILTQADRLSRLVDDLFELSRLQAGTFQLARQEVDLADVVSDAVADLMPAAHRRGVTVSGEEVSGVVLPVDPHAVTRAVSNLLANAIRFAPEGSEVSVAVRAEGASALIRVRDHGPGVPAADLERMFDVGWRELAAEGTSAGATPATGAGAGLGLAIARGIAEAHGGHAAARRAEPGLEVSISLPLSG
ncbi:MULTISPECIES: HAMP domain-containing sensor histidine kinase [Arthrobacter]|uniref:histidine kinase n=2 Tax=Arthrobacter TaxID=1663 RepID=A0ABU9KLU1_9MICC|nr:HAMP domain-containing sensor histidine kinase [Arthrobacter sp. YJM1]MDP5228211.1 HAMP domain-containing sensor histidine kinase [Arthrobacter sp. YJM1]